MHGERGSVTPLVALLVVLVGGACFAIGRLGEVAVRSARAQLAADAAALAGAGGGEGEARSLASANGADVVRWSPDGDEVEVAVRIGDIAAVARAAGAESGPGGTSGAGADERTLVPELQAALDRAATLLGRPVPISSAVRTRAEQQRLYDDRGANPYPVARPGMSAHERGRAVDVPQSFVARLVAIGARAGLCQPWPESDPVHFELCRRQP